MNRGHGSRDAAVQQHRRGETRGHGFGGSNWGHGLSAAQKGWGRRSWKRGFVTAILILTGDWSFPSEEVEAKHEEE